MRRVTILLLATFSYCCTFAQGTITFEAPLAIGSQSFSAGALTFTTNSTNLVTDEFIGSGAGGSDRYLDNVGAQSTNAVYSIDITGGASAFTVKGMEVYVSSVMGGASPTNDGTLTIRGKLSGSTQFTYTKSSGFPTIIGPDYGYVSIDFMNIPGQGNLTLTNIDELEVQLGGAFQYISIDNFEVDNQILPSDPPIVDFISVNGSPFPSSEEVTFRVTFNENANNVTPDDFSVDATGSVSGVISQVTGSGTTHFVKVTEVSGNGTLSIDLNGVNDIEDDAGNSGSPAFTEGEEHQVSNCFTESFEDLALNATTWSIGPFDFTSDDPDFNVSEFIGAGAGGSDRYLDNFDDQGTNNTYSISLSDPFLVKMNTMEVYLSSQADGANPTDNGSLRVRGFANGVLQYNVLKSTGFPTTTVTNNGYYLWDYATEGGSDNSNTGVDSLVLTIGGSFIYLSLDNHNFCVDLVDPTVSCNNLVRYLDQNGVAPIPVDSIDDGSSTPYPPLQRFLDDTQADCGDLGIKQVTLTVRDALGRVSTCQSMVTVFDTLAPLPDCDDATVYLDENGEVTITPFDVASDTVVETFLGANFIHEFVVPDGVTSIEIQAVGAQGGNGSGFMGENRAGGTGAIITGQFDVNAGDTLTIIAGRRGGNANVGGGGGGSFVARTTFNDIDSLLLAAGGGGGGGNKANGRSANTGPNGSAAPSGGGGGSNGNGGGGSVGSGGAGFRSNGGNGGASTGGSSPANGGNGGTGIVNGGFGGGGGAGSTTGPNGRSTAGAGGGGGFSGGGGGFGIVQPPSPTSYPGGGGGSYNADPNGTAALGNTGQGFVVITYRQPNFGTDNCAIAGAQLSDDFFDCNDIPSATTNLIVSDESGNIDSCTATVTVLDIIPPTMVCKDDAVMLDQNNMASITSADIDGGSTDACGMQGTTVDVSSFDCSDIGFNTVILTGTDLYGNMDTCRARVLVVDDLDPVALCQVSVTTYLDENSLAVITPGEVNMGSSDNCGIQTITVDPDTFYCSDAPISTATLTVTDFSGNKDTCSAQVNVIDTVPPTPNAVGSLAFALNQFGQLTIPQFVIDNFINSGSTDNCMGELSFSISQSMFDCSDVGLNTVWLYVSDPSGNVDSTTTVIEIQDNTPPEAICRDITVYLDINGNVSITPTMIDNGSNDACGIETSSVDIEDFDCIELGLNVVELTVVDSNGLSEMCTSNVNVVDTIAPVISCPGPLNQYIDQNCMSTVPDLTTESGGAIANSSTEFSGVQGQDGWFYGTHAASNSAGFNQLPNFTGFVHNNPGTTLDFPQLDPLGGHPNLDNLFWAVRRWVSDYTGQIQVSGDFFDRDQNCGDGAHVRIFKNGMQVYEYLNIPGSSTVYQFNLTVEPGDMIDFAIDPIFDAACDDTHFTGVITVLSGISVIENCSYSITQNPAAGTPIGIGITDVEVIAMDGSGNADTCTVSVTVADSTSPMAACQDITLHLDVNGLASITPDTINNGSGDNCGIESVVLDSTDFDCSEVGNQQVTLTVTDIYNNSSSCVGMVQVRDTVSPEALCQDITLHLDGTGNASIIQDTIDNGSNDACDLIDIAINKSLFNCNDLGNNAVTLTVTDMNTNTTSCMAVVTVLDTVRPTLVCQDVTVTFEEDGTAEIDSNYADGGSFDACGVDSISLSQTSFTCADYPALDSLTMVVVDVNGNADSCVVNLFLQGTDRDGDLYYEECDDCDDDNPDINPGVDEICGDGIDNNCDMVKDDFNGLGYCCGSGTNANAFIDEVTLQYPLGSILTNVPSGPDMMGYGDYTDPKANILSTYVPFVYFNIKPGLNRLSYIRVWVDWNQNGDFDPYEMMAQNITNTSWNGQFSVPFILRSIPGEYYVRIGLSQRGYIDDPCEESSRGEYEDYIVCIANGCGQAPPIQLPMSNDQLSIGDNTIFNLQTSISIEIRPNPFVDNLILETMLPNSGEMRVTIFNQQGQTISTQLIQGSKGFNQLELETFSLATGMYYVRVRSGDDVIVKRVVKQ